jgi:hypothetical protein
MFQQKVNMRVLVRLSVYNKLSITPARKFKMRSGRAGKAKRQEDVRRAAVAGRGRDIFRERLAVARRRTARRSKVTRRKENSIGRNCTREKVVLGNSKVWTLGERQRGQQQCNRGTRIETYRKTTGHETEKRIA